MYGTSSRFKTTFLRPCCNRLLILSFSSSSPSPSVILPFRSRTITSPADRCSICMVEDYKVRRTRHVDWSCVVVGGNRGAERLAAGAGELPLLKALLAKHRSALRRTEWHRGVLSARRALSLGLDTVAHRGARTHPVCPLGFASLAALRFVLELLVGEEEL